MSFSLFWQYSPILICPFSNRGLFLAVAGAVWVWNISYVRQHNSQAAALHSDMVRIHSVISMLWLCQVKRQDCRGSVGGRAWQGRSRQFGCAGLRWKGMLNDLISLCVSYSAVSDSFRRRYDNLLIFSSSMVSQDSESLPTTLCSVPWMSCVSSKEKRARNKACDVWKTARWDSRWKLLKKTQESCDTIISSCR